jgi:hypothetical protein
MIFVQVLPRTIGGQEKMHQDQMARESKSLEHITSILADHHVSAFMEYQCVCADHAMFGLQALLRRPSSQSADVIQALRQALSNDRRFVVQKDGNGLILISDRRASQAVMAIRIRQVVFDENEQYNPNAAIEKVLESPEVQSYFDENRIDLPTRLSELIAVPQEGLPHLDPEMKNVTVLDAIKLILQKFPQLAVYRECSDRDGHRTVSIDFH